MISARNIKFFSGLLLLLSGCTGNTLQVDDGGTPRDDGATSSKPSTNPTMRPTGPFSSAQVMAAQAACSAPHGTASAEATRQDVKNALEGGWYDCTAPVLAQDYQQSGSFDANGNWRGLEPDGSGGLVEGQGLLDVATYDVFEEDDAGDFCDMFGCGVDFKGGGVGETQLSVAFETSPTRMLLAGPTGNWFVPLGD